VKCSVLSVRPSGCVPPTAAKPLIVILGGSVAAGEGGPSVFVVSRSRLGVFAVRRRRLRGVFVQR